MLQQRLGGELGFLQSTEESLRQLTDVERTRAVALAQQETVALAQIVKVRCCRRAQSCNKHCFAVLACSVKHRLRIFFASFKSVHNILKCCQKASA